MENLSQVTTPMTNVPDFNFTDMHALLEDTFRGCTVVTTAGSGTTCDDIKFGEFEVRVLLAHSKNERIWHIRFRQVSRPHPAHDEKRSNPTVRILREFKTAEGKEAKAAVVRIRAHLLGITRTIQAALLPKAVVLVEGPDDLFDEHDGA